MLLGISPELIGFSLNPPTGGTNLQTRRPAAEVEVWEIPSARWERGRSVQPPAKRRGRPEVGCSEIVRRVDPPKTNSLAVGGCFSLGAMWGSKSQGRSDVVWMF